MRLSFTSRRRLSCLRVFIVLLPCFGQLVFATGSKRKLGHDDSNLLWALSAIEEVGYSTHVEKVQASDYGAANSRGTLCQLFQFRWRAVAAVVRDGALTAAVSCHS